MDRCCSSLRLCFQLSHWTDQPTTNPKAHLFPRHYLYTQSSQCFQSERRVARHRKCVSCCFSPSQPNRLFSSRLLFPTLKFLTAGQLFPPDAKLSSTPFTPHVAAELVCHNTKMYITCINDWWDLSFNVNISAYS